MHTEVAQVDFQSHTFKICFLLMLISLGIHLVPYSQSRIFPLPFLQQTVITTISFRSHILLRYTDLWCGKLLSQTRNKLKFHHLFQECIILIVITSFNIVVFLAPTFRSFKSSCSSSLPAQLKLCFIVWLAEIQPAQYSLNQNPNTCNRFDHNKTN